MLRSEASGRRSRPEGEKKRRFIKAVKEGMKLVGGEKRVQIDGGRRLAVNVAEGSCCL